jgi:hypothetical protein
MKIYIHNGRSVEDREGKTIEPGIQVKTDERDCLGQRQRLFPKRQFKSVAHELLGDELSRME